MKIYDRYFARAAITSTVSALAIMVILYLAIDFLANLDQIGGKSAIGMLWSRLYAIPPVLYLLLPLIALLGGMSALARLLRARELTPLRVAGVRTWRALMAFWIVAALVGGFAFALKNLALPAMGAEGQDIIAQFGRRSAGGQMLVTDGLGNVWLIGKYKIDEREPWVEDVTIARFGADSRLTHTLMAPKLVYRDGGWWGSRRELDVRTLGAAGSGVVEEGKDGPIPGLDMTPSLIARRGERGMEQSIAQLRDSMATDNNPAMIQFEIYQRFTFPIMCVSLMLIGAVLALRRQVGNQFVALALSAGVALLAYAAVFVFGSMVERGSMTPEFASFMPAIVLAVAGLAGIRWLAD